MLCLAAGAVSGGRVDQARDSLNFSNGWKADIRSSRLNDAVAPFADIEACAIVTTEPASENADFVI
jgi:hypothetical protein